MAKQKKSMVDRALDLGLLAKSIKTIVKWFSNPIVLYVAIGILIIILGVGVIYFFESMPSMALGWINDLFISDEKKQLTVTDDDIKELCIQLEEEYEYDLEAYGLVESITRGPGTADYNGDTVLSEETDEETGETVTKVAQKGEIISVQSKYLKSYILAERKSYLFANPEDADNAEVEATEEIIKLALSEVVDDIWGGISNEINGLGREDKTNAVKYILNKVNDNFYTMDINDQLKKYIDSNFDSIKIAIRLKIEELYGNYGEIYGLGSGLIYIQPEEGKKIEKKGSGKVNWTEGNIAYTATIDRENKWLIIEAAEVSEWWQKLLNAIGLLEKHRYAYDLNGWTCKYGKTTEFLIGTHLATMAPDFVYQLATNKTMDTKVYVDMLPINIELKLQTEEGRKTINEILNEINFNLDLVSTYKEDVKRRS